MNITPLEIKQKTFEKAFRGFEKHEVQAFLASLASEWERLQNDYKSLKQKFDQTQQEVVKLREVEDSLFKTLKTAEDTRSNLIDQATKSAELHLKEAHLKTDAILNNTRNQSKSLIEKAEQRASEIIQRAEQEARTLRKSCGYLDNQKEQLINQLRMISEDLTHKIQRLEQYSADISSARAAQRSSQANGTKPKEVVSTPKSPHSDPQPVSVQKNSVATTTHSFFDELEG